MGDKKYLRGPLADAPSLKHGVWGGTIYACQNVRSLVPRPSGAEKTAWYRLFAHARALLVVRITPYTIRSYSTVYYRIWYSRTRKCRRNTRAGYVIRP